MPPSAGLSKRIDRLGAAPCARPVGTRLRSDPGRIPARLLVARRRHGVSGCADPHPRASAALPDPCAVTHPCPRLPHQQGPHPQTVLPGCQCFSSRRPGASRAEPRTATLTYFRDGADLVVIGSFGGSDLPPAWWLNLQRDPRASVLIGGTTSKVTARAATAEEHDRLWPLVTQTHPGYARYQERTARPIPIVLLTPLDAEARLTPG